MPHEVVQDAREGPAADADLETMFDRYTARLQNWMLKLVVAQTALFVTIAVGAVVVAGVLWG